MRCSGCSARCPSHGVVAALALCGSLIGFAPFNRPVARIFLGDVGSLPIGLMIGWLLIEVAGRGHLAAALILPLYYLADATLTLLRRMAKDREPFYGRRTARISISARHRSRGFGVPAIAGPRVRHQCRAGRCCALASAMAVAMAWLSTRVDDGWLRAAILVACLLLVFAQGKAGRPMTRILLTGASGFVGRGLVTELANASATSVRAAMRQPADVFPRSVEVVAVSDLTRPVEWRALLKGVETVVHLAGIAHAGPGIAEEAYDRINRLATAEIAHAAQGDRPPASAISSSSRRSARKAARLPQSFCARPIRLRQPTPTAGPSSPRKTPCAPPACRSRSCGAC